MPIFERCAHPHQAIAQPRLALIHIRNIARITFFTRHMLNARFLGPHGQPPIVNSAAIDKITTNSANSTTFKTGS